MRAPGPVASTGRYLRLALITVVVAGWVPLLAVTGSRALGGTASPMVQLAPFAPLAAAGWVVAVLALLAVRCWWLAGVATLLVVVHALWLAPPVLERLRADPVPTGVPVRVLALNAQYGGADVAGLVRLVTGSSIDIVSIEELTPDLATRFTAAIGAQLPYSSVYPVADAPSGTGVWSRWPVTALGTLTSPFQMPRVSVAVPGAGDVEVIGVHTMSPVPGRVPDWNTDLATLTGRARQTSQPLIMLGDFNATRDHRPFRRLLSAGMADASELAVIPPWKGQTWPADRRWIPPVVRIDHVLVSRPDFVVSRMVTATVAGTDHRAVLAYLAIRPGRGVPG